MNIELLKNKTVDPAHLRTLCDVAAYKVNAWQWVKKKQTNPEYLGYRQAVSDLVDWDIMNLKADGEAALHVQHYLHWLHVAVIPRFSPSEQMYLIYNQVWQTNGWAPVNAPLRDVEAQVFFHTEVGQGVLRFYARHHAVDMQTFCRPDTLLNLLRFAKFTDK
jgi:hypothetical protein